MHINCSYNPSIVSVISIVKIKKYLQYFHYLPLIYVTIPLSASSLTTPDPFFSHRSQSPLTAHLSAISINLHHCNTATLPPTPPSPALLFLFCNRGSISNHCKSAKQDCRGILCILLYTFSFDFYLYIKVMKHLKKTSTRRNLSHVLLHV